LADGIYCLVRREHLDRQAALEHAERILDLVGLLLSDD
jgi:hypothetical protein